MTAVKAPAVSKGESIIKAMFMEYCGNNIVSGVPKDFIRKTHQDFGFSEDFILKTIQPLLNTTLSYFESTFLDLSKGGMVAATNFEKAVCNIFNDRLLFKASHTGQKKRPSGVSGYADIFIVALDDIHCALIDAKASPAYNISSADYQMMVNNYIKNYSELCGGKKLKLEFCIYIAGGFFASGVKNKLKELKKASQTPVSAISAVDFLAVAKNRIKDSQQPLIRDVFKRSDIVNTLDFKFLEHG